MTRFYLIFTTLLAGGALAQEPAQPETATPGDPNLWIIVAAGLGTLVLIAFVLKLRQSRKHSEPLPEKSGTPPKHPKKKIENPITLKQKPNSN